MADVRIGWIKENDYTPFNWNSVLDEESLTSIKIEKCCRKITVKVRRCVDYETYFDD